MCEYVYIHTRVNGILKRSSIEIKKTSAIKRITLRKEGLFLEEGLQLHKIRNEHPLVNKMG